MEWTRVRTESLSFQDGSQNRNCLFPPSWDLNWAKWLQPHLALVYLTPFCGDNGDVCTEVNLVIQLPWPFARVKHSSCRPTWASLLGIFGSQQTFVHLLAIWRSRNSRRQDQDSEAAQAGAASRLTWQFLPWNWETSRVNFTVTATAGFHWIGLLKAHQSFDAPLWKFTTEKAAVPLETQEARMEAVDPVRTLLCDRFYLKPKQYHSRCSADRFI